MINRHHSGPRAPSAAAAAAIRGPLSYSRLRRANCTKALRGGDHRSLKMLQPAGPNWRDWAGLPPELAEQIASWLLRCDVTEYLRFRAACKAWRMSTVEPRSLESPFRPRRWIMLSNCDGARRRFLNLTTGACAHVDLPELYGHSLEGSTEGLLVLHDKGDSNVIRLLHPFTRSLVELPSATAVLTFLGPALSGMRSYCSIILKACISDETSPPSLALFLYGPLWNIAYAKPGDEHWTLVDEKGWASNECPNDRRLLGEDDARRLWSAWFASAVTLRGRIYYSTFEGNILMLQLHPRPVLVPVIRDENPNRRRIHPLSSVVSYLVPADDDGESLLMVRFYNSLLYLSSAHLRILQQRKKSGLFKVHQDDEWYKMQVFRVDLPRDDQEGDLVPVHDSIGQRAVFIGGEACVSLSSRVFPSVYGDAVYFGTNSFCTTLAGVRRLNDGTRAEPRLELVLENGGQLPRKFQLLAPTRIVPSARPCSLEEYLVCYVGCKEGIKD